MRLSVSWSVIATAITGSIFLTGCAVLRESLPVVSPTQAEQVIQETATLAQPASSSVPAYPYLAPTQSSEGGLADASPTAYPSPEQAAEAPDPTVTSPYPGPEGQVLNTPEQAMTLVPAATTPYPDPGAVSTPTREIRRELLASDPSQVQLASGKIQLIEFFAFWDGLSKAMAPTIHGLENEFSERLNFIYLDVDDPANDRFKLTVGYKMQPEIFLIDKHGNIIYRWSGAVEEDELRAAIEAAIR